MTSGSGMKMPKRLLAPKIRTAVATIPMAATIPKPTK
jgi:hypothetical protein